MELEKIRNLSEQELHAQEAQAGEQLFRIRFQKTLGNTEGLKKLRGLKLDVARLKTIARERQLAALKSASPARNNAAPAASNRTVRKREKKA
jgi:large subunit ribosomal protein L29